MSIKRNVVAFSIGLSIALSLVFIEKANANIFGTTNNFRTFSQAHSTANALASGVGIGGGGYGGSGIGYINTPRSAHMAYAPPAYPTATCLKAYSGGGSGLTFGFSAGVTVVDTECRIYEGMRALVNVANNNMMDRDTAQRMMMDITCEAETMATTRDCKKHLAMREEEDSQMVNVVINTDTGAMEEVTEVTTKRAKFEDLFPWNWGS
jgi:hypothetical protein